MSKTTLLALACAAAFAAVDAHAAVPTPSMTESMPAWAPFDAKIADAKKAMMADPKAALENARQANALAQSELDSARKTDALATSLWLEGESLTRMNKTADAKVAIDNATKLADADHKTTALDGNL